MMDKEKIQLEGVAETLLIPLCMRARDAREKKPFLNDQLALQMVQKIDYDFSKWDSVWLSYYGCVARAKAIDDEVRQFIHQHPQATIISIGSGLDTRFQRIDNGEIRWYDLDFPEVIQLRAKLLPQNPRVTMIAKSALDPSWTAEIEDDVREVLIVSEGVIMYFTPEEVREMVDILTAKFSRFNLYLDLISPFAARQTKRHDALKKLGIEMKWGSRDGSEVVAMAPALTQTGVHNFTDEMRRFLRGWKMLIIPFFYWTNNRLGMYFYDKNKNNM